MTIGVREFTRNIYKYLVPNEYVVTKDEVPVFKVVVTDIKNGVVSNEVVTPVKNAVVSCKHLSCDRDGSYYKGFCMEHWRECE